MRRAMEYSLGLDMVLAQHCEVAALTRGAVMHEGRCCSDLGLPGWPAVAEELMVHRDIELCRLTGARLHLLHLSTARSVEMVRAAKAEGLTVTAEAAPHHLSLTDDALRGYDPVFKVNPPLRTAADVEAAGRRAGRRHDRRHRHRPRPAPGRATRSGRSTRRRPGWSGWRRRSACACRCCSEPGCRSSRSSARCRWRPAAIAGLSGHGRPIAAGEPANLTVFDPDGRAGRWCRPDWPAAATTRRSSAGRCAAGCATPCSPARRP